MLDRQRRRFLRTTGLYALGLTLCPALAWASPDYYRFHAKRFLRDFRATNAGARQWLAARHGPETADQVARETAERFAALLPGLPDVGGATNPDTKYLVVAGWYAAYYPALAERGLSAEELGRMIYDLNAQGLKAMPRAKALALGRARFTPEALAKTRQWAAWTGQRTYPAGWVARFVEGDGQTFDWGYDYSECAVLKYLESQGAGLVAPYVCLNDFLRSHTLGTGLHRRTTLAQGGAVCDFRYKLGREATQDWDTEVPRFPARFRAPTNGEKV